MYPSLSPSVLCPASSCSYSYLNFIGSVFSKADDGTLNLVAQDSVQVGKRA